MNVDVDRGVVHVDIPEGVPQLTPCTQQRGASLKT